MEILAIILGSFVGVFGTLALVFWKAYSSKKAENVAAIEDTGTITEIQEAVRVVFQKELATFQFEHQHKLNVVVEQRNAIFDYTESLYLLRSAGEWSAIPKKDYFKTLRDLNYQYQLKQARMKLLFDNVEFEGLDNRFRAFVEQLHSFNAVYFSKVQVVINTIQKERKNQTNLWQERVAKLEFEIDILHKQYSGDHWKKRQEVDAELSKMLDLLRKMLASLFDRQMPSS